MHEDYPDISAKDLTLPSRIKTWWRENCGSVFGATAAILIVAGVISCTQQLMQAEVSGDGYAIVNQAIAEQPLLKPFVRQRIEDDGYLSKKDYNDIMQESKQIKEDQKRDQLRRTLKEH